MFTIFVIRSDNFVTFLSIFGRHVIGILFKCIYILCLLVDNYHPSPSSIVSFGKWIYLQLLTNIKTTKMSRCNVYRKDIVSKPLDS